VLDALDEVHEARRGDLIRALDRLTSKAKNLKVLICSRRDDDIMQNLEKKTNLGIGAADNQADIRKFILERLEKAQTERRRPMSDNLRNDIVETLLKRSQGM
jgi:peptidyl-tRNA hydrolase